MELCVEDLARWARQALDEDLGAGDITARLVVPAGLRAHAQILCREPGVLAGMAIARQCFQELDPEASFTCVRPDGSDLRADEVVVEVQGDAHALLAAERTALNFLQRLSGIATRTRAYVEAVRGTGAVIMNTRKTTPLLRDLERYAVEAGGGTNHRRGLFDQVLLKENHFALAPGGHEDTVRAAVQGGAGPVIAEARNLEEGLWAVRGGAAVVMLDNLSPEGLPPESGLADTAGAVRQLALDLGQQVLIEASGGVSLDNVRTYADAGVDRISVGALTHSVPALDFSMLVSGSGS